MSTWLFIFCYGTSKLVALLLSPSGVIGDPPFLLEATHQWFPKLPLSPEDQWHLQHKWDVLLYDLHYTYHSWILPLIWSLELVFCLWPLQKLNALSMLSLGTKPDNESLHIVLGLYLGAAIDTCVCSAKVDIYSNIRSSVLWHYSFLLTSIIQSNISLKNKT